MNFELIITVNEGIFLMATIIDSSYSKRPYGVKLPFRLISIFNLIVGLLITGLLGIKPRLKNS